MRRYFSTGRPHLGSASPVPGMGRGGGKLPLHPPRRGIWKPIKSGVPAAPRRSPRQGSGRAAVRTLRPLPPASRPTPHPPRPRPGAGPSAGPSHRPGAPSGAVGRAPGAARSGPRPGVPPLPPLDPPSDGPAGLGPPHRGPGSRPRPGGTRAGASHPHPAPPRAPARDPSLLPATSAGFPVHPPRNGRDPGSAPFPSPHGGAGSRTPVPRLVPRWATGDPPPSSPSRPAPLAFGPLRAFFFPAGGRGGRPTTTVGGPGGRWWGRATPRLDGSRSRKVGGWGPGQELRERGRPRRLPGLTAAPSRRLRLGSPPPSRGSSRQS